MGKWNEAQTWEKDWWSTCQNTYGEEMKQLLYAQKIGLKTFHDGKSPFNFDLQGESVLDVGGGPVSLLLKCYNVKGTVLDPCDYPAWIAHRYQLAEIAVLKQKAEDVVVNQVYDEVWIYNVLQHTEDPQRVIQNMRAVAKLIRLFEWIGTDITPGHPHTFTREQLDAWLGGEGKVERLSSESTCIGTCYYGIFEGGLAG